MNQTTIIGKHFIFSILFIVIFILFSFSLNTVEAANASTIYVSSHGNDGWNGQSATYNITSKSGPKLTISGAIGVVAANGIIHVSSGIYRAYGLKINKNIEIIGESQKDTIINGTNSGTIFNVAGVKLSIINLTLTNGRTTLWGGAVNNLGTLSIVNSSIENSAAGYGGGGIANDGSLNMMNTIIYNNSAATDGGAIWNDGSMNVSNCTIEDNKATNGCGGAIYNEYASTITSSTFAKNTANDGGSIYNNANGASANSNIKYTTFLLNSASDGGAVYNDGDYGTLTLYSTNNIFEENNASNGGATVNDGDYGSAIEYMSNTIFTLNSASDGGALFNTADCGIAENTIINCTVDNNSANDGGAIYNTDHGISTIKNSFINFNSAQLYGGAICNYNATSNINYNIMTTNTATNGGEVYNNIGTVNATYDWWGSCADPSLNISGNVNITPWLTSPLFVENINPPNGSEINITNKIINIILSESIEIGNSNIEFETSNGTTLSFTKSINNNVLSLIPTSLLNNGLTYDIIINNGSLIDLEDNSILSYNSSFKVDTIAPTANSNTPGGSYDSQRNVVLNMSKPGTIYFTVDGTTPTTASTVYTTPIIISKTSKLKFLAVDLAGNKSPIYAIDYNIAPKISLTTPKNNAVGFSLTSPITIKFTENIIASANYPDVTVKNLNTGKTVSIIKLISGNTLILKPQNNRIANDTYEVYIPPSSFKDYAGNNLSTGYNFKFKTI